MELRPRSSSHSHPPAIPRIRYTDGLTKQQRYMRNIRSDSQKYELLKERDRCRKRSFKALPINELSPES